MLPCNSTKKPFLSIEDKILKISTVLQTIQSAPKKVSKIALAVRTTATVVGMNVLPASAWASFEHPFNSRVGYQSQANGDSYCRNYFNNWKSSVQNTIEPYMYAQDGVRINNAWHVWYHQGNRVCVANK